MLKASIGPEEIFTVPEGNPITFRQLVEDLDRISVIFIGETHDQMEHHQIQLRVLHGLMETGKDVVIAMEMFEKSQQSILDRWSEGLLTEEEFLKEVNWEKTWGMDYDFYKGILDEVKRSHIKVLGLNIQKKLVRNVAENGIPGLSPEDKKKLPEMDLSDKQHRAYIASVYKSHPSSFAKDFEHFYKVQCLWDEAMADTLSEFLKSPNGTGKTILIFAGGTHIVFDFGIPKRFYRRTPIPYKTIILKEWKKDMDEDLAFVEASSHLADFLWITRPTPGRKGPRIGVVLKEQEEPKEIGIERVIPGSPADRAGLLPGDQLIAIEGMEIKEVKEIHHALAERGWGKEITFTILRNGLKKDITVTLPPLEE